MIMCVDDIQYCHKKILPYQIRIRLCDFPQWRPKLHLVNCKRKWEISECCTVFTQKSQRPVLQLEKGIKMSLYSLSHIIKLFRILDVPKLFQRNVFYIENSQIV